MQVDDVRLRPGAARREMADTLRALRRRVGMVFQQFHLFPHMSVLENVLAGPLYVLEPLARRVPSPRPAQLLERVGLAEKLAATPDQLSGGQQQRVAIARALAMKPEAILFDEPTSALDPRMAAEVISVITDLAKAGQTMIVVTHAMGFARNVSHTVHVMHAGRVAESGPPSADLRKPATRQSRHEFPWSEGALTLLRRRKLPRIPPPLAPLVRRRAVLLNADHAARLESVLLRGVRWRAI